MVKQQVILGEARQLRRILEETHMKMQGYVNSKLGKYLKLPFHMPC